MKRALFPRRGFTIVELLVVIAVIGILMVIVVVAYNGVTSSARSSATQAALKDHTDKLTLTMLSNKQFPATLAAASLPQTSGDVTFLYKQLSGGSDYCMTALYKNEFSFHKTADKGIKEGPCEGDNGGTKYCPDTSYVSVNSFYCDGTVGSLATLNTSAVKLLATASGVPANAPASYVGRQTSRDNYINTTFEVSPGETYCAEAWLSTASSTVPHGVGMMFTDGSTNTWILFGSATAAEATNTWVKVNGCREVPAGRTAARVWTQTNATSGTPEVAVPWYQTGIRVWKE